MGLSDIRFEPVLTFGNIVILLTLLGGAGSAWVSVTNQLTGLQQRVISSEDLHRVEMAGFETRLKNVEAEVAAAKNEESQRREKNAGIIADFQDKISTLQNEIALLKWHFSSAPTGAPTPR